jgi:hypothetical protein
MRMVDYFYDTKDPSTSRDDVRPRAIDLDAIDDSDIEERKSRLPKFSVALAAIPLLALATFGLNQQASTVQSTKSSASQTSSTTSSKATQTSGGTSKIAGLSFSGESEENGD